MKLKTTVTILALTTMLQGPAVACFAATIEHPAAASAAAAQSEQDFIDVMAKKVLGVLKDSKMDFAQKQAALRELFTQTVDTDWIAKFVLGQSWKTATPEQKSKYTELYRTYLTETYISKFDDDSGSKVSDIKVKGVKPTGDTTTAHTEIVQTGNEPPVKVDYLLRRKDGQIKVIDINIEGVSLLSTHRQEFNALAASGGIDGVIKKLTQLITHKE